MKKILVAVSLALFVFTIPCFAKSKKSDEEGTRRTKTEASADSSEKKSNKKEKSKDKSIENNTETKKEEPKENKKKSESQKKNYAGWIDTSSKDIDFKSGSVYLRIRPKLGTFNIQVINDDEKSIPVLSTSNEYTNTAFYLKYNKKVYKLGAESNIQTSARKREDGVDLVYNIANIADVTVNFNCVESIPGNGVDMVKITSTVVNKGQKKASINLKLILDTVLGETDASHFYTYDNLPIKSEVMYRTMQNQKYVVSKNNLASMQILLYGADITPIESVALANYMTLSKNTWEPEMLTYRAFDTVLSYNNSAIGIYWPQKTVGVEGKTSVNFYIALASDANLPTGYTYIQQKDSVKIKDLPEIQVPESAINNEAIIIKPAENQKKVKEFTADDVDTAVKATKAEIPAPVKIESEPKPIPNIKFDVSSLTKDQLTPEYIQNLLDRILALEESDSLLNRDELLQLNAELDAILESLR